MISLIDFLLVCGIIVFGLFAFVVLTNLIMKFNDWLQEILE